MGGMNETETAADRIAQALMDRPRTLEELVSLTGCSRRRVQQLIADRGQLVERVSVFDGEQSRVVFRARTQPRDDRAVSAWLHCRTCGVAWELPAGEVGVLGLDALAKYSHKVDTVRLVGECASCRRRSGQLSPIGDMIGRAH